MYLSTSAPVNNPSVRKLLRQFSEPLYVKQKTFVLILGDVQSKHKYTITCHMSWLIIPKSPGQTKINTSAKLDLYEWILQHPQVGQ